MAGSGGSEASDSLPGWRLSLLLVGFLIASLLAEKFFHWLHHVFSGRAGLTKALESLKTELLLLGLMSLALVPLTAPLSSICIPASKSYDKDYYASKDDSKKSPYGSRRLLSHRLQPEVLMHVGRSLLAGSCGSPCKEDEELFWTAASIHDTHLLLFFAAFVYIIYTSLTLVVCLMQVRRWKEWERKVQNGTGDAEVDPRAVRILGHNSVSHWIRATSASFSSGVTSAMYLNIRQLFLKQMGFEDSYNFQSLVRMSIENQLAGCFKTEWVMWLYAAVLVAIPSFALAMFWTAILSAVVMLVMGAKLTSIAIRLSVPTDRKLIEDKLEAQFAAIEAEAEGKPKLGRLSLGSLYKEGAATPRGASPRAGDKSFSVDMEFFKAAVQKVTGTPQPNSSAKPNFSRNSLARSSLGRRSVKSITDNGSDSDVASRASSAVWGRVPKQNGGNPTLDYKDRIQSLVNRVERQRSRLLRAQGDARSLFWWRRPQVLLRVFRFIVFQNAMNMTLVAFSLLKGYKKSNDDWGIGARVPQWSLALLVVVDVCLALHAAWYVLPLYALVELVGSHCPKTVLKKAVKYSHLKSKVFATIPLVRDNQDQPQYTHEDILTEDKDRLSVLKSWGDNMMYQLRGPWRGSKQSDTPVSTPHADRATRKEKHTKDQYGKDTFLHRLLEDMHSAAHRRKMALLTGDGNLADNEVSDSGVSAPTHRPNFMRQSLPDLAMRSIPADRLPPEVVRTLHPALQLSVTQRGASLELEHMDGLQLSPVLEAGADRELHTLSHSKSTPALLHLANQSEEPALAGSPEDGEFQLARGIRAYMTAEAISVPSMGSSSQSGPSTSSQIPVDEESPHMEIKVFDRDGHEASSSKGA